MMVNERLKSFFAHKGLSAYAVSKTTGVPHTTVAHILRSTDVKISSLEKIVDYYPDLNIRWLITGKGEMLEKTASMEVSVNA